MSEITSERPAELNEFISVGQEFMEWAERYWLLKDLIHIKDADVFNGETCDYNYMRNVFIGKINNLIKSKLGI